MSEISIEAAITRARAETQVGATAPAQAWHTRRLDRPGESYYLVVIGYERAARALAVVDASSGAVKSSARLPGTGRHVIIGPEEAIDRAALGGNANAELVWQPSQVSRSMLFPFWEISRGNQTVYVDQLGNVWNELLPAGPGS